MFILGAQPRHAAAGLADATWTRESLRAFPTGVSASLQFHGPMNNGGLIQDTSGFIYGTTVDDGDNAKGSVFRFNPADLSSFTNLHSFAGSDGAFPVAGLTASGGWLYGTTFSAPGETYGKYGTIYRIRPDGSGFESLHQFYQVMTNTWTDYDGIGPVAALTAGADGTLYGTTSGNGGSGSSMAFGTCFKYGVDGFTLLDRYIMDWAGQMFAAYDGLALASNGVLYTSLVGDLGTRLVGLPTNAPPFDTWSGTPVMSVSSNLYTFANDFSMLNGPAVGSDGAVYGGLMNRTNNTGSIYRLMPGASSASVSVVYLFPSGEAPTGQLTVGPDGALYGSSVTSGTSNIWNVFRLDISQSPAVRSTLYTETISGSQMPRGKLLYGADGAFYGTLVETDQRGGTLFRLTPHITYTVAYNGNGSTGGGTASSQHSYGTASPLTLNGFTRDGYTFIGWNTAANGGGTSYADGETVLNLTDVNGATVTLYAQWALYGTTRDQINENYGYYFNNETSGWQSFTAGADGYLAAVALYVYSYGGGSGYSGGPDWTATLAIYAGTGTGGALLASQPIAGTGVRQRPNFFLETPPMLEAGGVYTIAIRNPSVALTYRASANLYAGGRCGFNSAYDLHFVTYLMASDWSDAAFRDTSFTVDMNVISNAAQLAQFAWLVNNGETYQGRMVTLANDIDLAAHYWVPAGPGFFQRFEGAIDGAGHSVNGIRIDSPATDYQGLFGCVGTEGTVRNLTAANAAISGHAYVGGIAGRSFGTLSNCTVTVGGTVSGTSDSVGGVTGCAESALFNCVNGAAVTGGGAVGGVAGEANGTTADCSNSGAVLGNSSVGGVAGMALGTLADCVNSGSVEATGGEATGGVAGSAAGDVLRCTNTGSVEGGLAAGVVGKHSGERIDGCRNAGAVTAMLAGGIVTMGETLVRNCVNEGTVFGVLAGGIACELHEGGVLRNCANTASIEGMSAAGGLAASTEAGFVMENCLNSGAVTASDDAGGLVAYHEGAATNCYWRQTGVAPFTLSAAGTDLGSLAACQPFGGAPGTLAASVTAGGVATNRLSAALNAWVAAAWTPGCGLYSWTAGTATGYPSLVPAIEVGGAVIPQTLGDRFMAGLAPAQVGPTVEVYTAAHPGTTAASFGDLMCLADAMGFTLADLAAGDAILDFEPRLALTGFDPATWTLTFQVGNGIDATAVAAMNRFAASAARKLTAVGMPVPGGTETPLVPTIQFGSDGVATATFDFPAPPGTSFFKLLLEHSIP